MLRYVKEKRTPGNLTTHVLLDGPLLAAIRAQAQRSQTSVASWCREALEFMIHEHRAGKFRPCPSRHWDRNGDDAEHVVD